MMKFSKRKDEKKGKAEKKSTKSKQDSDLAPSFPSSGLDLKGLLESQGCNLKPKESSRKVSKLSPPVNDMLKNPIALAYFMEYLRDKDLQHLVDFWLAVETFKVVSSERCKFHSHNKMSHDSENHAECNSCTGCFKSQVILASSNSIAEHNAPVQQGNLFGKDVFISQSASQCQGYEINDPTAIYKSDIMQQESTDWRPFCSSNNMANEENTLNSNDSVSNLQSVEQTTNRRRSTVIDAVGIYAKYVSLDADEPINVPSKIRNDIEAGICRDRDHVYAECFLPAQKFVFNQLEKLYNKFSESTFGNKFKLFVLRETKLKFEDILYDDHSLFYFMEYLDQETFREVVEFWFMVENFEDNISRQLLNGNYDINEAIEDAMSIYEKYFSMRNNHQLIDDDKLRIVIENNICREDGPQANCFCIPAAYAWTALKEIFFPNFLKSDAFVKLMESFLKNSIESQKIDDVSSTASSSDSRNEATGLLSSAASFPDFLDRDSDDLWYRPDAGRLAMGYVNQYGVFIPDMESLQFGDDKVTNSSVSKLGKAMKSLLNKESEEDKEKEAWQKARSIIDDIKKHAT
eukprot:gene14069-15536_t